MISLGQHKSDVIDQMIQLAISDYNKGLILLSVIQLSGGHCIFK